MIVATPLRLRRREWRSDSFPFPRSRVRSSLMGADVSVCPVPRLLERLLADDLGGGDRDAVESHVEHCSSCQDRLDRLIGATPHPSGSGISESSDAGPEPKDEFLARLRMPPRGEGLSSVGSVVDLLSFKRVG